jgi:exodeoxyribonuclease VII large subunit
MSNFAQSPASLPRDVLSVTSLNRMAKSLLEGHFPNVLVEGEISNLALPASGHWYFTLKDEGSQVRCAMFRNRNMGAGFRPRDGMQVLVRGRLSLYEGRGDYQLIAESVEEAGDGALRRRFEMLKQKLAAEGLFASERKRPLPDHVRHVGVITSATGAVIRDIISVLQRRFPAIRITLLPVAVQGAESPAAIVRAIATANRRAAELGLDVLIVGRGGGSLEDLQAFNEESVARAIHGSTLPVVSAVGHETDFTIADFVADLRAPTPSAAAELLSPDQNEMLQTLQGFALVFRKLIGDRLQRDTRQLLWLTRQLKHPGRRLQEHAQALDILEGRLLRATRHHLAHTANALQRLQQRLSMHSPATAIGQQQLRQDALRHRLQRAMQQTLQRQQASLAQLARSLDGVSPLQTLRRGYSITYVEQQVVRSTADLQVGQTLRTQLGAGAVLSTVSALLPKAQINES